MLSRLNSSCSSDQSISDKEIFMQVTFRLRHDNYLASQIEEKEEEEEEEEDSKERVRDGERLSFVVCCLTNSREANCLRSQSIILA